MFTDKNDARIIYDEVILEYEKKIVAFSYDCFNVEDCGKVYVIEDSFILFAGLINYSSSDQLQMYKVVFEEFSYNEIYKFNISGFCRKFDYGIVQYKKFDGKLGEPIYALTEWNGNTYETVTVIVPSQLEKILSSLPELKIRERYQHWEGFLYNFIIYELTDGNKTGFAICSTTTPKVHTVAQQKGNDVEMAALMYYPYYLNCGYIVEGQGYYNGVKCNTAMMELLTRKIELNKAEGWKNKKETQSFKACLAEKELKYFILPTYVKEKAAVYKTALKILANAEKGLYIHEERHEYLIPENRWKSEQLVFELTKQLFKRRVVLYQHRPFFLRSATGQLSYDVFVCGENIAIEYQGKQHFEPVEIFGGEAQFEAQKARDLLKMQLSKENGVRLMHINYWEDISIELIKEKIANKI